MPTCATDIGGLADTDTGRTRLLTAKVSNQRNGEIRWRLPFALQQPPTPFSYNYASAGSMLAGADIFPPGNADAKPRIGQEPHEHTSVRAETMPDWIG